MKKTLKVKIHTDEQQYRALLSTMNMFNQICNDFSGTAFEEMQFGKNQLQKIVYHPSRTKYTAFSSQLTIRAIDVVCCSYKIQKHRRYPNLFKQTSAVVYDDRVITFRDTGFVNIWTIEGRLEIPITIYDKELFKYRKGQVDLILKNKQFYLMCTLEIPEDNPYDAKGVIGIDLGVKNIATLSDGTIYSSSNIEKKRKQYHSHRARLQKRGTRSAKRRIKVCGSRESCYRKDVNHCISKQIIQKAKGTQMALALEELTNINKRVTVRKANKNERMSWSFSQLRSFIEYKALEKGIPVILVDPAYTSQTCSECGHCEKKNRKNQALFFCMSCGHTENADVNASKNIQSRGSVNIPIVRLAEG